MISLVELKEMLVALAAPNIGLTKTAEVDPANASEPVAPDNELPTLLADAITNLHYLVRLAKMLPQAVNVDVVNVPTQLKYTVVVPDILTRNIGVMVPN